MLKSCQGVSFIDLDHLSCNTEIPFSQLFVMEKENLSEKYSKFDYEEINVEDCSSSLYFTQNHNKILILVYGPRETRFREKAKIDECIIEVYSKFNSETSKESNY